MGRLTGRTIIVTGAAQGIGAAYASHLAANGASVFVSDVLDPEDVVTANRQKGFAIDGCRCDITDANAVAEMAARCQRSFGTIDGLVNNAALFAALPRKPLEEITSAEFDRVLSINVRGTFECIKAVLPVMRDQGYGKIVNVASGTVFKGVQFMLPYVTSKGAIVAMTRCVAREAGGHGIRVNCVAPGLTLSDGVKADETWTKWGEATVSSRAIKRDQEMTDLLGTVEFLLAPDSDFMTGQTLVVDGGAVMR